MSIELINDVIVRPLGSLHVAADSRPRDTPVSSPRLTCCFADSCLVWSVLLTCCTAVAWSEADLNV